jgi:hypothetical protein
MSNENRLDIQRARRAGQRNVSDLPLHPTWRSFVRYCTELQHGEIDLLKIQDGLPVLAEITRKKVKFAP